MTVPPQRFGAHLDKGRTQFRLRAPAAREVHLVLPESEPVALTAGDGGWFETTHTCGAGQRYKFRVMGHDVPDPASRYQEGGVHGWSVVCDPASYRWRNRDWKGRPWNETVLYELHPGLMGGFAGIASHLPRLAELGVTAIELMPIAAFAGARGWGYDGVLPYAPHAAYGTPDALKALVDDAHDCGVMVFLDVVYNHFGPDGNWLPLYAPDFFRHDVQTPWGDGIDFGRPEVRRFFIENALYWIDEFRIDGLRFDALHAIPDDAALLAMAADIRAGIPPGRLVHLVAENEKNDARLLRGGYDAQWDDDMHHALHVLLTGERAGYYEDYAEAPAEKLARALAEGFIYQGEVSPHLGRPRGTPSVGLPLTAFIAFLQNHDQIGNRAFGERLITLCNPRALRAAIALVLLAPHIPMLFMGEETGAREPFLYFTDHRDLLADAVREGRRTEFARFPEFSDPARRETIPDPNALETYLRSRPDFSHEDCASWHVLYRALLYLRRERIAPYLRRTVSLGAVALGDKQIAAHWRLDGDVKLQLATNLGTRDIAYIHPRGVPVWGEAPKDVLPAFTTLAWIATP